VAKPSPNHELPYPPRSFARSFIRGLLRTSIAARRPIRGTSGRPRHNSPTALFKLSPTVPRHGAAPGLTRCPWLASFVWRPRSLSLPAAVFSTVLGPPLPLAPIPPPRSALPRRRSRRLVVLPSGEISRSPPLHSGPVLGWCAAAASSSSSSSLSGARAVVSARLRFMRRRLVILLCGSVRHAPRDQTIPLRRPVARRHAGMDDDVNIDLLVRRVLVIVRELRKGVIDSFPGKGLIRHSHIPRYEYAWQKPKGKRPSLSHALTIWRDLLPKPPSCEPRRRRRSSCCCCCALADLSIGA
jgi:hypothetical protein